ncbi:putative CENPB DNA-binding domain-containing protein 1 [Palaemon carinicauda]|uniref:putative CENPB DNA-binding domain-containing protein 1 n=1 Tax=Palaemon carinicauda TaxID=392227 RepID=UPI0035B5D578
MGPQNIAKGKKKKAMLLMETKLEIVKKYESGMRLSVIAKECGRNPSTIGTIRKQKTAIKAATPSKGVTVFSNKKTHVHDEKERLLHVWIKDKEISGDTITETTICQKASAIFGDLVRSHAEEGAGEGTSQQEPPEFKASRGGSRNSREGLVFIQWYGMGRQPAWIRRLLKPLLKRLMS